jgi:macrodomain Ter protein organizer (MatP/YcbG family)
MKEQELGNIQSDDKWIFLELGHDDAISICLWISRRANTVKDDKTLGERCDKIIDEAINKAGLQYNSEKDIRLYAGNDGIAIPEKCFINPKQEIKRIASPFKSLAN